MPTANALRLQIETTMANRFPSALTPVPRTVRECAPSGVQEIDCLLDGGFPVGAISEITGSASSGRTCLALSFIAERTRAGQVCAWVDVGNSLDPASAASNGIELRRLLWVRCQGKRAHAKGKPRSGLDQVDQALRATDLLLQAGGFAAIVMDMGDLLPEDGRRIPLATWYRLRQAADQSRTSLVVLGRVGYAQASAAVMLECAPRRRDREAQLVLDDFVFDIRLTREKLATSQGSMRKPPASTWSAKSDWATGTKP